MSTPPPGGPQTPQPPYPQAPPPQYPPQYPPQQPYYAQPAAPPPKKSNTALIVVIILVVVVVVIAIAWYAFTLLLSPVSNATNGTVTGVSFTVNYPGSTSYFGTSPLTSCTTCPIHVTITNTFMYTLSLTNSDSVAHNVTDVSLTAFQFQFTLVNANPDPTSATPLVINPGATGNIVLTVQYTGLTGSNVLTGTITTT